MRTNSVWMVGVLLVAGLVFSGSSAPAGAKSSFGLSGGFYLPEDNDLDETEVFGIRGGYRFRPDFGVEATLSRVDLADTIPPDDEPPLPGFDLDFQVDLYNLDLSLQWFPRGGNFLVFGGPGVARIESEIDVFFFGARFSETDSSNIFTAHAGLAYQWQITDRFFIRPEARVRRYFDDEPSLSEVEDFEVSYEATDYEASVVFGWRLGS